MQSNRPDSQHVFFTACCYFLLPATPAILPSPLASLPSSTFLLRSPTAIKFLHEKTNEPNGFLPEQSAYRPDSLTVFTACFRPQPYRKAGFLTGMEASTSFRHCASSCFNWATRPGCSSARFRFSPKSADKSYSSVSPLS